MKPSRHPLLRWLCPPPVQSGDVLAYAGPLPAGCEAPYVTVLRVSPLSVWFEWDDGTHEVRDRRSFAWSFRAP